MDHLDRFLVVYGIRILCLVLFLCCTFTVTFSLSRTSLITLAAFLGSVYFLSVHKQTKKVEKKEKTKDIINNLYPKMSTENQDMEVAKAVLKLVSYNVEDSPALQNFETIKKQSDCLFARKAKVWGCPEWNDKLSLEENMYRMIPMFLKFTVVCSSQKLDGFVIELPGNLYGKDIKTFGDALFAVLKVLSDHDPGGIHCMSKSYIGKRGWVFEFNKITFFITTFAPFYPPSHARYAFGANNCYILFQPELSFAFHDLSPDTPDTNWENPDTVRDKIRVAFKEAGRQYFIPDTVYGPMAPEILRPVCDSDPVYEWWNFGISL